MNRFLRPLLILLFYTLLISCREDVAVSEYNVISSKFKKNENYDSAIYYAEKNLSLNLGNEHSYYSHYIIAYSYEEKNNFSKALNNYLKAFELIPSDPHFDNKRYGVLNNIGRICKIHSNYELATKYYNKARAFVNVKNEPGLLYNLGNAYKGLGNHEQAKESYLAGLETAINNGDEIRQVKLHHQLGLLYSALGDYESARSYYQTVINYTGNSTPAYQRYVGRSLHNMGSSYLYEQQYTAAIPWLEQALAAKKKEKDRFITYMDLGTCYDAVGKHGLAVAAYEKAEALYPQVEPYEKNIELFKLMYRSYEAHGAYEKSNIAAERYFAEITAFNATKAVQNSQYSAAKLASDINGFEQRIHYLRLLDDYKYVIGGLAIFLLVVLFFLVRMIKNYLQLRKRNRRMLAAGQTIINELSSLAEEA